LKPPGTKRLKGQCDVPLSIFAFKFNLRRYNPEVLRRAQAAFAVERDWEQFHTPRNLLLAMVGEVGELSEIFQWRGECAPGLPGWLEAGPHHLFSLLFVS